MTADPAVPPMSKKRELYTKDILRLAASLPHDDRIAVPDATASRRSPLCGSEIAADVKYGPDGGIEALAFRARACAMGQASAAALRMLGIGRDPGEIAAMRNALATALSGEQGFERCWPELAVFEPARAHLARHAAILLPYDAVLAAAEGKG